MSSLRNAVKRKTHKERGQLKDRKHLGLLEKKKDYVLRAKDYHKKQDRLQKMQLKAAFRNPDEFYFKMKHSATANGVHVSTNNHYEDIAAEKLKLMKTQDLAYLYMKKSIDAKKMQDLQKNLHFIDADKGNSHTIFVSDEKEAEKFDPVDYFETVPELVGRAYNRPRKKTLKNEGVSVHGTNMKAVKKTLQKRNRAYLEMGARLERSEKLTKMSSALDLERKVQAKGKKFKVKDPQGGNPAVYKWKKQRMK